MASRVSGIHIVDVVLHLKNYILASFVMSILGIIMRQFMTTVLLRYLSIIICIGIYFGVLFLLPGSREEIKKYYGAIKNRCFRR